jgi:hypothetical protein
MRLRLSDAATAAVLAEHYRTQATACQQMALMSVRPFREVWLELAAEWTKLADDKKHRQSRADCSRWPSAQGNWLKCTS